MIKVIEGKVIYRLDTKLDEDYNLKLGKFLRERGVSNKDLEANLDIEFKENAGTQFRFKADKFEVVVNIQDDFVRLLFVSEMDSDEFADFIEGYFESVGSSGGASGV